MIIWDYEFLSVSRLYKYLPDYINAALQSSSGIKTGLYQFVENDGRHSFPLVLISAVS